MTKIKQSIGANAVQIVMEPFGLVGKDERIVSGLTFKAEGVEVKVPVSLFPFVKKGFACVCTFSVVQLIAEEESSIILPGVN